ncbi:sticks and stones-like protein, partial [Sarcoptes scabiei]
HSIFVPSLLEALCVPPKVIHINSTRTFDNPNDVSISSSTPSLSLLINDGSRNASLFQVEAFEGEKIIITCLVPYSKPPSRLKWYRKNIELLPEAAKTTVSKTLLSNRHTLYSVESSLILYPKSDEEYHCQAEHASLSKSLRATAQINIFKKPSSPVIEGYRNGDIVNYQEKLTLKCTSQNGYPIPNVIWFRNGIEIDRSFTIINDRHTVINTLTFKVDHDDNQAQFTCQVFNSLTPIPLTQTITLNVFLFPTKIRIDGPTEVLLVENQGSPLTLDCSANPASPIPNETKIRWLIDGKEANQDDGSSSMELIRENHQSWTIKSNLTFVINNREPNQRTIECIDPPEMPVLLGLKNGQATVMIGEIFKLKCVCYSGNPKPDLISALTTTTGSGISSELVLRPTANDHDSTFRCHVLHPALTKSYEVTFTLQVIFHFDSNTHTHPHTLAH